MPANIGQIRRYYEKRFTPIVPSARARQDVLALLEDRKALQRAAEQLMTAAIPCSGDPNVLKAIENFRAVLDGRSTVTT